MDSWTAKAVRELKEELGLKPEDSLLRTVNMALFVIRELRHSKKEIDFIREVNRNERQARGT